MAGSDMPPVDLSGVNTSAAHAIGGTKVNKTSSLCVFKTTFASVLLLISLSFLGGCDQKAIYVDYRKLSCLAG